MLALLPLYSSFVKNLSANNVQNIDRAQILTCPSSSTDFLPPTILLVTILTCDQITLDQITVTILSKTKLPTFVVVNNNTSFA